MFGGPTYDAAEEGRLVGQLERVRDLLLRAHGGWVDLREAARNGEGTAGLTARARDLRKAKFGRFVVEAKNHKNRGLRVYRIPWGDDGKPMRGVNATSGGGPRGAPLPLGVIAQGVKALGRLEVGDEEFEQLMPLYKWLMALTEPSSDAND